MSLSGGFLDMIKEFYVMPFPSESDKDRFEKHLTCEVPLSQLCRRAIFGDPSVFIRASLTGYAETQLYLLVKDSLFRQSYGAALGNPALESRVMKEDLSVSKHRSLRAMEFVASQEVPRILGEPTKPFAALIEEWRGRHNVSRDWCDVGWHLRTCVDCRSREMQKNTIAENIRCAIQLLGTSSKAPPWSFATSDSHSAVEDFRAMLPQSHASQLLSNISKTFIHTQNSRKEEFEKNALPYLDHFLIGDCKTYVGCYTT